MSTALRLGLTGVAAIGLAACAQSTPNRSTAVAPPAGQTASSSFSARPPDNPTGSQAYQSPDLPARLRPPGGI